ncbi:MAG TPA: dihydropteroate synthase [Saprospiraceae bacterium]|nr:dihydropteroate synthase [Saprospiraceae bacterium]
MITRNTTLNCKGKILDLSEPVVVGILNMTPDSFYDGSLYNNLELALERAQKMVEEGAKILDIGGMSSRPGSLEISIQEEIDRTSSIIELISKALPTTYISIDTYRAAVVKEAYKAGAHIVNDISAGRFDPELLNTVAELKMPYILMHMQSTPADMQKNPEYEDVVVEVLDFFSFTIDRLNKKGIYDIIIDPGFGFGKTVEHNYKLLKNLEIFKMCGMPILAGLSRKSLVSKVIGSKSKDSLEGTTAVNMIALQNGANLLRVHDVKAAMDCIKIYQYMQSIN